MIYTLNIFREFSPLKRGVRGVLFFILTLGHIGGFSQTDTIAHLYTFGGNNNDNAEEIEATTDGGYIVVGSTSSNSSGNTDVYLLKVDSLCNYEWSTALGGTNNDWGYSIKQTFDKGFIIAASSNSYGNGGYDAVLMKRDSLGNYAWTKTYGGNDWDFAYSVVQTYDSGYVFCGETYNNTNGYSDVYIVKTNSLGDTLWTRTFGGTLIDKGNSVIETSDSNIVVAGITNTIADSTQIYIIKLTSTGSLLWDSIYGGSLYENANQIIETANGDFVTTGSTTSFSPGGYKDFYLVRIDKDGSVVWTNYFGNLSIPKDEEAFDLYEDSNGNLINVGFTEAAGGGMKDAYLFYISSGGWWGGISPTYGGFNNDSFKGFSIGNNGNFCMTGYTNSIGNGLDDILIVRVDTIYANQDTIVINNFDITPLTILNYEKFSNILIYPNPLNNYLNIEILEYNLSKRYSFEVFTIYGEKIKEVLINSKKNVFNFTNLSKQLYIYQILENNTVIEAGKLIVY
ncbi:MAG: hypothetical protein A3K10_03075 [Bacteroidetes bacterium RIFCSPLOWO2_12_FULL_31_6]|nr:MAG: hypothetical protein A3K10_03075 [Bacteroidetes bacterium RIFCSPLOWO2_12_FULL_31_6]